jgi:hypothetical protein
MEKFNVFCLRTSLLSRRFDVYASLQVKRRSMFDCVAFSLDLQNRDHVKALQLLSRFRFKLPGICGILPNLIDDQVKHVFEHVKLRRDHVRLPQNSPASARSRQASPQTRSGVTSQPLSSALDH